MKKQKYITSNRRFQVIYSLCLFTVATSIVIAFLFYLADLPTLVYVHGTSAILYLISAYIAKKGLVKYTRIIFLLLLNFGISISASYVGQAGSV